MIYWIIKVTQEDGQNVHAEFTDPKVAMDTYNDFIKAGQHKVEIAQVIPLKGHVPIEILSAGYGAGRKVTSTPLAKEPEQNHITISNTVLHFAIEMEKRLQANSHKVHWRNAYPDFIEARLENAVDALKGMTMDGNVDCVELKAADVGNYAMMLADVYRWQEKHPYITRRPYVEKDGTEGDPTWGSQPTDGKKVTLVDFEKEYLCDFNSTLGTTEGDD